MIFTRLTSKELESISRRHIAAWYMPSPLIQMLEEYNMTDLNKALEKTIAKMIKERVAISKSDLKALVKDVCATHLHAICEKVADSMRAMAQEEVKNQLEDGLIAAMMHNMKSEIMKVVAETVADRLDNNDIILIPKVAPCPPNAFDEWTHHHDYVLKERLKGFIARQALDLGRSTHAIYCRLRDKSFTKQEV